MAYTGPVAQLNTRPWSVCKAESIGRGTAWTGINGCLRCKKSPRFLQHTGHLKIRDFGRCADKDMRVLGVQAFACSCDRLALRECNFTRTAPKQSPCWLLFVAELRQDAAQGLQGTVSSRCRPLPHRLMQAPRCAPLRGSGAALARGAVQPPTATQRTTRRNRPGLLGGPAARVQRTP